MGTPSRPPPEKQETGGRAAPTGPGPHQAPPTQQENRPAEFTTCRMSLRKTIKQKTDTTKEPRNSSHLHTDHRGPNTGNHPRNRNTRPHQDSYANTHEVYPQKLKDAHPLARRCQAHRPLTSNSSMREHAAVYQRHSESQKQRSR